MSDSLTFANPATTDNGEHDRYAHYVLQEDLDNFHRTGREVRALCGLIWKPSRDATKYPVCPTCKEIAGKVFPSAGA